MGNLLGCLYVGCGGCGVARSLLLFGYVLVLCSEPLDFHFISFLFLIVVATGGQVIEVHRCSRLGGLLGGLGSWRGGSGGTFLREVVVSVGLAILFPSISFTLRLPQAIMQSRSIIAVFQVDS